MRAVNLIPAERRGVQRSTAVPSPLRDPLLIGSVVVAVGVAGAIGFAAHSASSTVSARSGHLQQLDAKLAKLLAREQQAAAAQGPSRVSATTSIAGQRTSWDGFLGSLSRVVPEDVWLLNLSANPTPVAPGTASPGSVTVTGYTYSQPSVARMMRRLSLVPWLQDVNLVTSTKTAIDNVTVYQFTLGASFVGLPQAGSREVGT